MKERIGKMVGQAVEGMPWLGTFHSIGARILRRHAELVGLKSDFTILDTDDQIRLLKQLIAAADIDEKRWPGRMLAGMIDSWKNRGLTPEFVPAGEGAAFANGKGLTLYKAYQARLKTLNAADFGDLLLENIRLFREHPGVLRDYQTRFKFILVDEYQDTNVAQYLWLRLLAQRGTSGQAMARKPIIPEDQPRPAEEPPTRAGQQPGGGSAADRIRRIRYRRIRAFRCAIRRRSRAISRSRIRRRSRIRYSLARRRSRPKTSAASATTTSRSTAGAARRSITSCASRRTFPARK